MSSTTQNILTNQYQSATSSTKYIQPDTAAQGRAMERHEKYHGKDRWEVFDLCKVGEEIEVLNRFNQILLTRIAAKSDSWYKVKTSLGYWAYYDDKDLVWRF